MTAGPPTLRPGDPWTGSPGSQRWRLELSGRLVRLADGRTATEILGPHVAAIGRAFLAVRPEGGRVWVDADGTATTVVRGARIYLGQVPLRPTVPPPPPVTTALHTVTRRGRHATHDATFHHPSTLPGLIELLLLEYPASTAREIAYLLNASSFTTTRKREVTAALNAAPHVFVRDGTETPRWRLRVLAGAGELPIPERVTPPARPNTPREVDSHTYDDLLVPHGVPVGPPVDSTADEATVLRAPRSTYEPILNLFAWQVEGLAHWHDAGRRGIVEAVTGTGKSHVGLEAVARAAQDGVASTILVPSVDLQRQWCAHLARTLPRLSVATVGGLGEGRPETADVTVAVVNSAARRDLTFGRPGMLLIADEVHRYGAETFRDALRPGYARRLGLTATLERSDDGVEEALRPYFGPTVMTVGFDRALADGVVADFRLVLAPVALEMDEREEYDEHTHRIHTGFARLRSRGYLSPDDPPGEVQRLAARLDDIGRVARGVVGAMRARREILTAVRAKVEAVEELSDLVEESQGTVIFTQSKPMAERAAAGLRTWGVSASALHGEMRKDERQAVLDQLRDHELKALAAPKLLDEGIDLPTVDLGIVLAASRTRRQMVQRLGRIIRKKENGRVVDLIIVYAAGTVEDPSDGAHEGFFDLVTDVATSIVELVPGWTLDELREARLASPPPVRRLSARAPAPAPAQALVRRTAGTIAAPSASEIHRWEVKLKAAELLERSNDGVDEEVKAVAFGLTRDDLVDYASSVGANALRIV